MWLIDKLAEQAISQARREGQFDDLPGAGRPLELEDDSLVPESLRAGYRLLKNAGCLPPELEARREYLKLQDLLAATGDGNEARRAELEAALRRLELTLGDRFRHWPESQRQQLAERLSRIPDNAPPENT